MALKIHNKNHKTKINFSNILEKKYLNYCNNKNIEPSFKGFVEYLLERSIITQTTRKRYLVLDYYPQALWVANGLKSRAVEEVGEVVGLSERTIYYILKDHQKAYNIK